MLREIYDSYHRFLFFRWPNILDQVTMLACMEELLLWEVTVEAVKMEANEKVMRNFWELAGLGWAFDFSERRRLQMREVPSEWT